MFNTPFKATKMLAMLFIVIIAISYSCTKTGPAGPAGPAGAAGATGATGATGPSGIVNVTYSAWFTPNIWTKTTVFGMTHLDFNQAAPGITQDILDKGEIIVYGKLNGYTPVIWPTDQVSKLPISLTYISGSTQEDTWSGLATLGNIRINFVNSLNTYSTLAINHSFRYIIIPGGTAGTIANRDNATSLKSARVDYKAITYDQVCNALNISK